MATYIQNLTTARDNLASELAIETAARLAAQAAGNGVKTTYGIAGRNYDWNGYLNAMNAQIKALNDQIAAGDPNTADAIFELHTRGYS